MRKFSRLMTVVATLATMTAPSIAGDVEIRAAQSAIETQILAFRAGDNAQAYGFAAPNIRQIFPTLDAFMSMVQNGYQPVWKPKNYAFGKVEEPRAGAVAQQVMLVGPDGKDYEAVYTLELQPDGQFRITGVSLRGATSMGV